jgi:hypothetical protein
MMKTTANVKAVLSPPALRAVRMSLKISSRKMQRRAENRETGAARPTVSPHRPRALNAKLKCTFHIFLTCHPSGGGDKK